MSAVCIDEREALGGACLNVGCIPSKTLLHWSERFEEAGRDYAKRGIRLAGVELDLPAMMAEKERTVARLAGGVARLFEGNGVERVRGAARLVRVEGRPAVAVNGAGGERTVSARRVVIATGSEPAALPGVAVDGERIFDSTGALSLARVPRSLAVIGAGYIGLELGSVWRRLGAKVTVVEALDRIAPGMDRELAGRYRQFARAPGVSSSGCRLSCPPPKRAMTESRSSCRRRPGRRRRRNLGGRGGSGRRRPAAPRRRAGPRGSRGGARRTRLRHGGTATSGPLAKASTPSATVIGGPMLAHKATAEAQCPGRNPRWRPRRRRLRHRARGDLHRTRGRLGRAQRGGAGGRGRRLPQGALPLFPPTAARRLWGAARVS